MYPNLSHYYSILTLSAVTGCEKILNGALVQRKRMFWWHLGALK